MYVCSKFFLRHSNETLAFPITVGKFFFNKCVPIGPCVPTGTFTLVTRVYHFSLQYNEDRKMKALICSMGQRKSLFNRI